MKRLLLLLAFVSLPSAAADQYPAQDGWTISGGAEYSSGKYGGATSTDILYLPFMLRYATTRYAVSLTVPYISVTSGGGVIPGVGGASRGSGRMTNTATSSPTMTQSGLGDVIATAGYNLYGQEQLTLNLVGSVKFGTANENKSLGTGKNDYAAQIDMFYAYATSTLYTSIGYKVVGVPVGYTFNNIAYGSVGMAQTIDERSRAGLTLNVAQSMGPGIEGRRDVAIDVMHGFNEARSISAKLSKGLSTSSPDWLVGLYLTGPI
ncbi:hypothetical protein [Sideroxydans lithotrophicus]|uniref:Transporter n=1 Tax=Sideroxydans lithotrophicus (strain ES-1) TaxID=580332 RepID=D5CPG9_SIDLE|nr:hypothetical protein [Sideroxydans lithotrophicus]ADE11110.1 hypothetical protein Slit_0872 [Sideroxydans lithotrophicus ES-1]